MNKFATLILFYLFYQLSFGQNEIIDNHTLQTLKLKGKVKSVKSRENDCLFDTLGNLILETLHTDSGSIINYSLNYDLKFRISEIYDLDKGKIKVYSYDSLNRVVSSVQTSIINAEDVYINKFHYGNFNLLIQKDSYNNGVKLLSQIFKYDSLNRLVLSEYREGGLNVYQYNEMNQLVKTVWMAGDGTVNDIKTYTYEKGMLIAQKWLLYEKGKVGAYIDEKYEKGLIKEEIEVYLNSQEQIKHCFSYKFDKEGNWIKMTRDDEGEIKSYEREIEYY